jgi:hypothetical protein
VKRIGTFTSARWGHVIVLAGTYGGPHGPTAIVLQTDLGEPLATLSVNMYWPECSEDSRSLAADCFYVKTWAENEDVLAMAAPRELAELLGDADSEGGHAD